MVSEHILFENHSTFEPFKSNKFKFPLRMQVKLLKWLALHYIKWAEPLPMTICANASNQWESNFQLWKKNTKIVTCSAKETQMNTESPDVASRLAVKPDDSHLRLGVILQQLGFVDWSHSQLTFHGWDQRRALEQRPFQGFNCLKKGTLLSLTV